LQLKTQPTTLKNKWWAIWIKQSLNGKKNCHTPCVMHGQLSQIPQNPQEPPRTFLKSPKTP